MRTKRPVPVKTEQRNSFGLAWFTSEADALAYEADVRRRKLVQNGGWFHGSACGRASQFDYHDAALGRLYAVTD